MKAFKDGFRLLVWYSGIQKPHSYPQTSLGSAHGRLGRRRLRKPEPSECTKMLFAMVRCERAEMYMLEKTWRRSWMHHSSVLLSQRAIMNAPIGGWGGVVQYGTRILPRALVWQTDKDDRRSRCGCLAGLSVPGIVMR